MASRSDHHALARRVLAATLARPATLGSGRLLCIDGLAGSGKTTLAAEVVALAPTSVVIATDEMLEGWGGLPGLPASIGRLLLPLADDRPGRWRRWDWYDDGWAETRTVAPGPLLVLEGVGSAASSYDDLITYRVWLEADRDVRLTRGLARDGDALREQWEDWLEAEQVHELRQHSRDRADLVVDTTRSTGPTNL
ncbi:uridine kinase [Nocardioides caeni]|uniref:uridine kinase family protein n=1 Tax=Nocardioides caeni TaxID=574700 RepID=UPI0031F111F4